MNGAACARCVPSRCRPPPGRLCWECSARCATTSRLARAEGQRGAALLLTAVASLRHHSLRAAGAALGSRAGRLPPALRQACSLEGRAGFHPLEPAS